MWARAQADAGELWVFGAGQAFGRDRWLAHVHWRRRREGEVMISGLKADGFSRETYRTILAELGKLGFTSAAYFRMQGGTLTLKEGIRIMNTAAAGASAPADMTDKKLWVEFGYIDDKGRKIVQRSEHDDVPHSVTRAVQLAVVGALVALPGDGAAVVAAKLQA